MRRNEIMIDVRDWVNLRFVLCLKTLE
jgi:hypothetical protein